MPTEGKESEEKERNEAKEEQDSRSMIDKVQEYCTSEEFEGAFEAFAKEFSDTFLKSLDFEPQDEHPLEFHDVYEEYLHRFERKIERFLEQEGLDPMSFYAECKDVIENDEVFGARRFFVEALLATSEYEAFFLLMKSEMYKYRTEGGK